MMRGHFAAVHGINSSHFFFYKSIAFTIDAGIETDILFYRQVFIQGELLAHISYVPLDLFRLPVYIKASYGCLAGSGH